MQFVNISTTRARKISNRIFSFFSILSILFQTLSGVILYSPVYAEETTPTPEPTVTVEQVAVPTEEPVVEPTAEPKIEPTSQPSPTIEPTATPTESITPTAEPTTIDQPSPEPTSTPTPEVTAEPTLNSETTVEPTATPTPESQVLGNQNENGPPDPDLTDSPIDQSSAQLVFSVSTDLSDYAPESIIKISGTGYQPNQNLTIRITWPDGTIRGSGNLPGFTDSTTANEKGELYFEYQLTGGQEGNYKLEVLDVENRVLASTTFTDAIVPANKVAITMFGFVLSGSYSVVGGQPTGTGELKNGNVGAYPEGACIPAEISVKNKDSVAGDILISPIYDYKNSVIGIDHLEKITTSLSGDPRSTADNLNDFSFTGSDLTANTTFAKSSGGTIGATITGPYSGDGDGTAAISGSDTFRHYNINLPSVPAGVTVYLIFCGRLGVDASEFNGSSMSIRTAQGGAENIPIPVNQLLQLPSLTLTKVVDNGIATPDQWSFNVTPSINGQSAYLIPTGQSSVTINNVSPDGIYTVTESSVSGYSFASGTGTSCTFNGSIATATVAAGKPATNASCVFHNSLTSGTLLVHKTYTDQANLPVTINVSNAAGAVDSKQTTAGDASFSLSAGIYSAAVAQEPSGYHEQSNDCIDKVVTAGQTTQCTIVNTPDTGSLTLTKSSTNGINPSGWTFNVSGPNSYSNNGVTSGTTLTGLKLGTYTVTEIGPANYHFVSGSGTGCSFGTNGTLTVNIAQNGNSFSCTYTNAPDNGSISGLKFNDVDGDGLAKETGEAGLSGWTIEVRDLAGALAGSAITAADGTYSVGDLIPGTYSVCEITQSPEWTRTFPGSNCYTGVVIGPGGQITGKNFGNFQNIDITACKNIDSDGDGQGDSPYVDGWLMTLKKGGITFDSQTTGRDGCYTWTNLGPGSYSLEEETKTGWTPIGSTTYDFGTVSSGTPYSHTFGNFENVSVTACKLTDADGLIVTTGDRGAKADWPVYLTIDGTRQTVQSTGENGCYTWTNLGPGYTYGVEEDVLTGWTALTPTTRSFGLATSGNATYSYNFINTALGTIIVEKQTDPDGDETDFTFSGDVAGQIADEEQLSTANLLPGQYSATETVLAGWSLTDITCNDSDSTGNLGGKYATFNLQAGETITCVFTNTKQPTLIVNKVVVNNSGGTRVIADFPLFVDSGSVISGVTNIFSIGQHTVSETQRSGYLGVIGGDCATDGTVDLAAGDDKVCTVTNDDIQPLLTVNKIVLSSSEPAANFPLFVDQASVLNGVQNGFDAGSYVISETANPDYSAVISGDCAANGSITLALGDVKSCTITNTKLSSITIVKDSIPDSGQDFEFTGDLGTFLLDNDSDLVLSNTKSTTRLSPGTYSITESVISGWDLTGIVCDGEQTLSLDNRNATIYLSSGEDVTCTFTNTQRGGIGDTIFEDTNSNGVQDPGEPGITGVTVNLYSDDGDSVFEPGAGDSFLGSQTTNGAGEYLFSNLIPGNYWVTVDGGLPSGFSITTANDPYLVNLAAGVIDLDADFGYVPLTPTISLVKTNDHSTGASAGDTVTYTLTLTNGLVVFSSVKITDVLPFGFSYVLGSAKVNGISSEPNVSGNVLTWTFSNVPSQAVVTITYQAKINSTQQAGIYYNLATCKGLTGREQTVNCQLVNSSVPIGRTLSYSDFIGGTTNNVLGASTQVLGAATGSETYWLILAIMMILSGVAITRRKGVKNV